MSLKLIKTLKLAGISLLALISTGCGRKILVPEKTIVAAYVDLEKTYDNGKKFSTAIIHALPDGDKSLAQKGYEEALKTIDKFRDNLKTEWAVIAFGGDFKSLARDPQENLAVAIRVDADEDDVKKVLKDVFGDDGATGDKKNGHVVFELFGGGVRLGLIDEKYIVFSPSKDAFDDMFDLYAGNGKAAEGFDDLSKISGDTVCRIQTAPLSSLLKRFELTREIEKFGKVSEDEDLANMILNMGSISLDVNVGDEVGLALSVDCDSSNDAKTIESLMRSVAFLVRVGCDAGAFGAENPELLGLLKLRGEKKEAVVAAKSLLVNLAKSIEADRSGSVATLAVMLETEKIVNFIEKVSSEKKSSRGGSGDKLDDDDGLSYFGRSKKADAKDKDDSRSYSSYRRGRQKEACISNMKQIQAAAEIYMMSHDSMPAMSDICGPDKYIKTTPTCPTDQSSYRIYRENGGIAVRCGSGDPEHVLPTHQPSKQWQ